MNEEDTMNATMKKTKAVLSRYVSPDITEQILSYLPCKSLLRFKVVCKQWEYLLHDSRFIDKHRRRSMNQPSHFLELDNFSDDTEITLHMYEIGIDGYSHAKTVKTTISKSYEVLIQSSYGLVCLYGFSNRKLVIINPNSEQIRMLPDYPEPFYFFEDYAEDPEIYSHMYYNNLGFGFDVKSKRYKVVQLVHDSKTHGISKCHVLTLERFESRWREINDASLDCEIEDLSFPVCVDGVIYWETKWAARDKNNRIMTFDLRYEKINMILVPEECKDDVRGICGRHLVELQGNLCYVVVTCTFDELVHMGIWRLNYSNDGRVGWPPMYKLELGSRFTCPYIFPVCINGRRIILRCNGGMHCYDVEEKCLKTYKGNTEDLARSLYFVHTDTIVSLD